MKKSILPHTRILAALLGLLSLAFIPHASAIVLVQYNMDSGSPGTMLNPSTVSSLLNSATAITTNNVDDFGDSSVGTNSTSTALGSISTESGFSGSVSAGGLVDDGWQVDGIPVNVTDFVSDDYFEFTVDPLNSVNLAEVYFDMWSPSSTTSGSRNVTLQINSGSGFVEVGTASIVDPSSSQDVLRYTFDISSIAATSNDVTFRFNPWSTGTDTGNGNDRRRIDNITVTVIPEPSAAALLLGVAAIGLVLHRRRRHA